MNMARTSSNHRNDAVLGSSLGAKLAFARESLGIPIERAAHETRIRPQCLRAIESDTLLHLSPGYARLFIRDYAKYLGVSAETVQADLPESGAFGTQGYQYIQNASAPAYHVVRAPKAPPRKSRLVLLVCMIAFAVVGGFQVWTLWRKLDRIRNSHATAGEIHATKEVAPNSSRAKPATRELNPANPPVPQKTESPAFDPENWDDAGFMENVARSK